MTRLERWKLGRVPAVILLFALFIAAIGGLGWVVTHQLLNVAGSLSDYKDNIEQKVEMLRSVNDGPLHKAANTVSELGNDIAAPVAGDSQNHKPASRRPAPTARQVFVVQPRSNPFSLFSSVLGPILGPIGTACLVIVFSIFILLNRENLRNRALRLAGQGHLNKTTQALDEAGKRVSKYLFYQSIVNVTYGCLAGIGLKLLGVPNPLLWGVLSGLFRYIPYIGPLIGAALPTLLALGAFPGWEQPLLVASLYLMIELVTAYLIEPSLYGSQTGITSLGILVAAVFWTVLWGPVGLLLSTPLTVCLVAFGKHIPQLEFVTVLFGNESVLPPEAKVYQRLLADDLDEVRQITEEFVREHSVEDLYDAVLIPVLILAEQDRHREILDAPHQEVLFQNIRDLIENTGQPDVLAKNGRVECKPSDPVPGEPGSGVAIVAASLAEADDITSLMLLQLAKKAKHPVKAVTKETIAEWLRSTRQSSPLLVCISALSPYSLADARAYYKMLKKQHPDLQVIVALWKFTGSTSGLKKRMGLSDGDPLVTTLADAQRHIHLFSEQAR